MKSVFPALLLAGVALAPIALAQPATSPAAPGSDILFQPSPLTTMPSAAIAASQASSSASSFS